MWKLAYALLFVLLTALPAYSSSESGMASWYGPRHHGKVTASGGRFDQWAHTAAHRRLPFGTVVEIRNLNNGRAAVAVITDRGPYAKRRILDVSRGVAHRLGMIETGTARVGVVVLHSPRQ